MKMRTTCSEYRSRLGPEHSIYGQNEDGVCYCMGCMGDEELWEDFKTWVAKHVLNCTSGCVADDICAYVAPCGSACIYGLATQETHTHGCWKTHEQDVGPFCPVCYSIE